MAHILYIIYHVIFFSQIIQINPQTFFLIRIFFFFTNYCNEKHLHDNIIDIAMHRANIYIYIYIYIYIFIYYDIYSKKIIILIINKHIDDKIFGYSHVVCINILIYYT